MPVEPLSVILSACRTPIGSFGGSLKDVSAADLGAVVIREALTRAAVDPAVLDDVIMGCVLQSGAGMNVARQAAVRAGVPVAVPAETINRVCGSGLQAVVHATEATRGYAQVIVAGGTESMSQAPYLLPQARWGLRMGHGQVYDTMLGEGLTCAIERCHMGMTAEEVARRFGIGRAEQDAFAADSQTRAAAAIAAGAFRDEIVAVPLASKKGAPSSFDTDEHPRPGATAASLGGLKPAFTPEGTVTAGNASGINDGAAALVVASPAFASARGLRPIARVLSYAVVGVEPIVMGLGPVGAVRLALERADLSASDIDLFELNEAFAAQALAVSRELGLDGARVNTRGGAIALGHPIGASGARVLTTLIYALRAGGGGRGLASLCIGGGMGIAMVVEVS
ncbi:MAG TPA: acetyl-CoA C-acetyltransferase [Vicinamibacterales bacterium]|jgi:acetyl-CoA C-acetyltransferase|nr:acetyl-CoA C-acetyltransferase [Vicinamibacterales bacterium]HXR45031.1 acetyl-CoA C-acetyltransferase [Pseudolysinimonas sp.]